MRISDWSSDVCSSDLTPQARSRTASVPSAAPRRRAWRGNRREPQPPAHRDIRERGPECPDRPMRRFAGRSEEHTSELQSLMRISYAVFCLKKKKKQLIYLILRSKQKLKITK